MASQSLRGRRILAVEDDYFQMLDLERLLAARGAVVIGPAASIDQALAFAVSEHALDAAVLDVNLRGGKAYVVADALSARDVPFVFASGYDRSELDDRYFESAYCRKPLNPHSLEQALLSALQARTATFEFASCSDADEFAEA